MPGEIWIPNEIWDAWCKFGSPKERVYKAIIRLTWGWRRDSYAITQADIAHLTRITNRSQISKLTSQLVNEKRLIKISNWGKPTEYAPNRDYEQWIDVPVKEVLPPEDIVPTEQVLPNGELVPDQEVLAEAESEVLPPQETEVLPPQEIDRGDTYSTPIITTMSTTKGEIILPEGKLDVGTQAPTNARAPNPESDNALNLFLQLWIPANPREADMQDLEQLIADKGAGRVLKYLQAAAGTKTCRRNAVVPYVRRCFENEEQGVKPVEPGGTGDAGKRTDEYGL